MNTEPVKFLPGRRTALFEGILISTLFFFFCAVDLRAQERGDSLAGDSAAHGQGDTLVPDTVNSLSDTLHPDSLRKVKSRGRQIRDSIIEVYDRNRGEVYRAIVIEGDTIPLIPLDEVLLYADPTFDSDEARRRYYILRRKVHKVYPYAVIAGTNYDTLNARLDRIDNKRKRKKYIKLFQEQLEEHFEDELKKLTRTEGQILCKLLYRETGITAYELIKEYRSGWKAFWYNVTASFYDISLKKEYDPENNEEDALIEGILQRAFAKGELEERERR